MSARILASSLLATLMIFATGYQSAFAQQAHVASVAEDQAHLLQLAASDSLETAVPFVIENAISRFKEALASQTDTVIMQLPAGATAALVRQHLAATMPSATVGKISDEQRMKGSNENSKQPIAGLYGRELTLSVSQPVPSLMLVQESFDIACGDDTVLLAYSNASGAWQRTLLWQSKPYDQISGAFGDTYLALLLKQELNNHPLLLVVHGTPWCTSTGSSFDMDVLELGNSAKAAPLWHEEHSYRRADLDPQLTLRLTAGGFEIRTSVSGGGDRISRKGIMRYSVTISGVHRVEPLAMNARDSVVEWLEMPQKEAVDFADEPAGSLTWQMFKTFTYESKGKQTSVLSPTFAAVRACKDSRLHFQAEVSSEVLETSRKGNSPGPTYFVQLLQVSNGYRIHAVTLAADKSCSGPDLMAGS